MRMTVDRGFHGPARRVAGVALVAGLALAACSSSDDGAATGTTQATAQGPSSAAETSRAAEAGTEEMGVTDLAITVEHAELGPLTFDAIAAGDPGAAAEGRLVLLLHGFPESYEAYRDFLGPLAEAGYYAVAPNQRGYSPGARPTEVEDYSIFELVGDVQAIATELGAERFHLVGHDWGGGIAWAAAAFEPDRLSSLSVLSTPHPDAMLDAFADPTSDQVQRSSYVDLFTDPDFVDGVLADGEESFAAVFGTAGGLPRDHVGRYFEVLSTPEALSAALNYYRATPFDDHPRMGAVRVPTLYVFGDQDLAFSTTSAELTANYVDADYRYEVIAGGSHWLPETVADEIVPMVLEHIEDHP
jgi:pimeloyl-ACP methyl ester carboxylesterase